MMRGIAIHGRVLADLRELSGLNQEELSFACEHREHVKVAREEVSRYEREIVRPTVGKLLAMCAVLKVEPGSATWKALIRTPTLDERLSAVADRAGGEDVDRQLFLKSAGASAAVGALTGCGETFERVAFMLRRGRVDAAGLELLERQTRDLQDGPLAALPAGVLLTQARAHYDATVALLEGPVTVRERRRLAVIAGSTSLVVGWLQTFVGVWAAAYGSFAAAAALGRNAGHPGLEARSLGSLAQVHRFTDRPSDLAVAVDYSERAFEVGARGGMDANSRSWLTAEVALARAARKDRRGFDAGITNALDRLGGGSTDDVGGRFVGPWNEHSVQQGRGVGLMLLDDPEAARKALEETLSGQGLSRNTFLIASINLGEVYTLTGDAEEGCRLLGDAHTACAALGYGLGLRKIDQAAERLSQRFGRAPYVRDLDERMGL